MMVYQLTPTNKPTNKVKELINVVVCHRKVNPTSQAATEKKTSSFMVAVGEDHNDNTNEAFHLTSLAGRQILMDITNPNRIPEFDSFLTVATTSLHQTPSPSYIAGIIVSTTFVIK